MDGFGRHRALLRRLGKHESSRCCLYLKTLSDVDLGVLDRLIRRSVLQMKTAYPGRTR